jgi:ATPase family protein associated with various cellular activities (AAA)
MDNIYNQKVINANNVFDKSFLDTKNLYLYYFNSLPSLHSNGQIDGEKAYKAFKEKFGDMIVDIHQYKWYKDKRIKYQFYRTIVVLKNNCLVEFYTGYCEILHDGNQQAFIDEVTAVINKFRERRKRQPLEINLVVDNSGFLELKTMEIKRTKLDLDLFYEDDFKEVDEVIRRRLNQKKDKGIVLLHGLPGAGKTTYLRHLIGKMNKRVLFLSPSLAGNLMNPEFLQLLIDNPNTVLIIEDAENLIMDRKNNNGSSVSGLLNISDGLLADFLNVQIICTFNSSLTLIDSALLRKGRLIAKYEFGKLGVMKAKRLSRHLGFDANSIDRPMTIAEIANPNEMEHKEERQEIIGFRRDWTKELLA